MLPQRTLVISGGRNIDFVANARIVGNLALKLGVNPDKMIVEDSPRDTVEEAELLVPLLAEHHFVLVISSWHMPRALHIVRAVGMQPLPAPTDFTITEKQGDVSRAYLLSCKNVYIAQQRFHEWLGSLWSNVKG